MTTQTKRLSTGLAAATFGVIGFAIAIGLAVLGGAASGALVGVGFLVGFALAIFAAGEQLHRLDHRLGVAPGIVGCAICAYEIVHYGNYNLIVVGVWVSTMLLLAFASSFSRPTLAYALIIATALGSLSTLHLRLTRPRSTRDRIQSTVSKLERLPIPLYAIEDLPEWQLVSATHGIADTRLSERTPVPSYSQLYKRQDGATAELQFFARPAWFHPPQTCAAQSGPVLVETRCPSAFMPLGTDVVVSIETSTTMEKILMRAIRRTSADHLADRLAAAVSAAPRS